MRMIAISLITSCLAACATPSQPGGPSGVNTSIQVQAGREFDLQVGQQAKLGGTSIVIDFDGVSNDSRCPSDVQCISAGSALVRLSLSQNGGAKTEIAVNSTVEPKSASFGGYRVRLTALKPATLSTRPIPAAKYVATLEVTAL